MPSNKTRNVFVAIRIGLFLLALLTTLEADAQTPESLGINAQVSLSQYQSMSRRSSFSHTKRHFVPGRKLRTGDEFSWQRHTTLGISGVIDQKDGKILHTLTAWIPPEGSPEDVKPIYETNTISPGLKFDHHITITRPDHKIKGQWRVELVLLELGSENYNPKYSEEPPLFVPIYAQDFTMN